MDSSSTLEAIFLHALEKPSAEARAAYLDQACAGASRLRQAVEKLLRAHEEAGSFLQFAVPAPAETHNFIPETATEGPGSRIGPYKLLQQIGEGGMGTVFMAEQEQPVRRRVALKVIKPGMDSAHVLARFRAEQQALAMMDHQHIARVFDAGVTASGRPYFVMELVHGVPITKYCDDNKLSPRERLELFVPVCRAVQHAHQKGIIHRDLKPSNVLVCLYDGKPVAKVIDFGVAKAMEQPLTEQTMFTQFGQVVGTLEYMSPEQAEMSQLGIDTRSDVYSLGVLLYELLTGSTPLQRQRLKQAALHEALRMIREEEPPPPSARLSNSTETLPTVSHQRRTDPAQLWKLVRGELDWIVLKSLEKDRTRRYGTADGLARDLERHLADEPVEASPPSTLYRLRKYARKHRVLLTTAIAFALLLLLGTTISVWQAIRATEAEGDAEKARAEAILDRDDAVKAGKRERAARLKLDAAGAKLRRALYAADMNLVRAAWDADQPRRAFKLLENHRPQAETPDVRGFEWYYWQRRLCSEARRVLLEQHSPAADVAGEFSPSGRRYAEASRKEVTVWDTETGRRLATIPTPPGADDQLVLQVRVAFGSQDDRILRTVYRAQHPTEHAMIDLASQQTLFSFQASNVHISSDGKHLLTCLKTADNLGWQEIVWRDPETGREMLVVPLSGLVFPQFSADGARVASVFPGRKGEDAALGVFETRTGKLLLKTPVTPGLDPGFVRFSLSADGKRLVVDPMTKTPHKRDDVRFGQPPGPYHPLAFWDVDAGKQLWTRPIPPSELYPLIVLSPEGRYLKIREQTFNDDGPVYLIDAATGAKVTPLPGAPHFTPFGWLNPFSRDGELLVLTRAHSGFSVYATASGQKIVDAKFPMTALHTSFTRDGQRFLVVDAGVLRSWDVADWRRQAQLSIVPLPEGPSVAHIATMHDRSFDAHGRVFVSVEAQTMKMDSPRLLKLLKVADNRPIQVRGPFPAKTYLVGFDEVDRVVLSVPTEHGRELHLVELGSDRRTVLWNKDVPDPERVPDTAHRILFLPDRQRAVLMLHMDAGSGFPDAVQSRWRLALLDLAGSRHVATWLDNVTDAVCCSLSTDGKTIALLRSPRPIDDHGPRQLLIADIDSGRIHFADPKVPPNHYMATLSPDGQLVALTSEPSLLVRDTRTGAVRFEVAEAGLRRNAHVLFSPDSRRIALLNERKGRADGPAATVRLIDVEEGNELGFVGLPYQIHEPLTFSPDGRKLLGLRFEWPFLLAGEALEVIDATPVPVEK